MTYKPMILNNAQGARQIITTLTAIAQKVSEQKFYEIPFADYVPVVTGVGAYDYDILNWRSFSKDDGFEKGLIGTSSNRAQRGQSDAVFDAIKQKTQFWAKNIEWSVIELEQAAKANNIFSLVEARERARKKAWDLGLQKIAFLGLDNDAEIKGLLNSALVLNDTTTIVKPIKAMTAAELQVFVGAIYEKYRANCVRTAKPTKFIIPEGEFNGLHNFPDITFPLKTRMEILLESFKSLTGNQAFEIMPCAYADKANNPMVVNRYVLTVDDPTSVVMNLPIDYTVTQAGTEDGFSWVNSAYGQFSGVTFLREKETLYFSHAVAL
jgi:hypothetical protein